MVAVCPKDVVSVPNEYNSKCRCCAYMPIAVLDDEETIETFLANGEGFEVLDNYYDFKIDDLVEMASKSTAQDLKKQYMIADIKQSQLDDMVDNIESYKTIIQSRIYENTSKKTIN